MHLVKQILFFWAKYSNIQNNNNIIYLFKYHHQHFIPFVIILVRISYLITSNKHYFPGSKSLRLPLFRMLWYANVCHHPLNSPDFVDTFHLVLFLLLLLMRWFIHLHTQYYNGNATTHLVIILLSPFEDYTREDTIKGM